MRIASIRLAERKIAGGSAPVFMYLFAQESPALNGQLKAAHLLEVPYVFDNLEPEIPFVGSGAERKHLAAQISGAWIAFARSGDPNHPAIPRWPVYSQTERATMILDTPCRMESDPLAEDRRAWDGII